MTQLLTHGISSLPRVHGRHPAPRLLTRRFSRSARLSVRPRSAADEPDLVTKIFGKLFGQQALDDPEPFGLKRLDDKALAELYPATTTEFADPVETDTTEIALFRPLLSKTQLEDLPLRQAYDAEQHGWTAKAFHSRVDGFGAAVVLCTTVGGAVCGGYNPKGWISLGDSRDSQAAFLFTWPDGDTSKPAIKLPKVGGAGQAVLDKADSGPQFGPEGFTIFLQPGKERLARSRLGAYYAKLPGGGRSLFSEADLGGGDSRRWGNKEVELTSLKVFVGLGEGEEWELDGIVWKTKRKD